MFRINGILRVEEGIMFLLSIYLFTLLSFKWWLFPILLILPDIGILGYLINTRVGAAMYNVFHHKGLAIATFLAGIFLTSDILQLSGIILFGHASLDRFFGFGLKYPENFKHTHLGNMK
jgi:hypothetical protein